MAPAMQGLVPEMQLQYQPMHVPAPAANLHHLSPQQDMQNEIRVMIESELAQSCKNVPTGWG